VEVIYPSADGLLTVVNTLILDLLNVVPEFPELVLKSNDFIFKFLAEFLFYAHPRSPADAKLVVDHALPALDVELFFLDFFALI